MAFTDMTKYRAALRQSKWDGWGTWCAGCGKGLAGEKGESAQRTLGENWEVDNCVILCVDCFEKTDAGNKELHITEIPYFRLYPDRWHGNSTYVFNVGQTSSGVEL
jgi:hypothetical protein